MISALILAAGTSSRYGGDNKLLLPFHGQTVLSRVLQTVAHTVVAKTVLVTGHQADGVLQTVQPSPAIMLAHNPAYRDGEMLSSIQTGLRYLFQHISTASAAFIILGDQPLLQAEWVNRLAAAHVQGCGGLIAPRYRGQRGHPVLIDRRYWAEVLALPMGRNVRDILQKHHHDLAFLDLNTDAILLDVDTPEAYAQCLERIQNTE